MRQYRAACPSGEAKPCSTRAASSSSALSMEPSRKKRPSTRPESVLLRKMPAMPSATASETAMETGGCLSALRFSRTRETSAATTRSPAGTVVLQLTITDCSRCMVLDDAVVRDIGTFDSFLKPGRHARKRPRPTPTGGPGADSVHRCDARASAPVHRRVARDGNLRVPTRPDEEEDPMNLGPMEIGLIILAILLLFGYKKLPDASRSLGRSLRIFKGEMKGMKDDDVRTKDAAKTAPVRGEVLPPASPATT